MYRPTKMVEIEGAVEPDAEAEAKAEAENVSTLVPLEDRCAHGPTWRAMVVV